MPNVFEGALDARQSGEVDQQVSHALTDAEKALLDVIKAKAAELESLFKLWAIKELTS